MWWSRSLHLPPLPFCVHQLHEVMPDFDFLSAADLACDVVCLVYDVNDPRSFEYCAKTYKVCFRGQNLGTNCCISLLSNWFNLDVFGSNTSWTAKSRVWWLQPSRTCTKYGSTTAFHRWNSVANTSSILLNRSRATPATHSAKNSTPDSPPWPCIREYYPSHRPTFAVCSCIFNWINTFSKVCCARTEMNCACFTRAAAFSSGVFSLRSGECAHLLSFCSHVRLRCLCGCNRCTYCLCQNLLKLELLRSIKAQLRRVVFNRLIRRNKRSILLI